MMAQVVAQAQKEALPQGAGISSLFFPLPFIFISSSLFFFFFFFGLYLLLKVLTQVPKVLNPWLLKKLRDLLPMSKLLKLRQGSLKPFMGLEVL